MGLSSSFFLFSIVMAFTPGPNNIMIMTSGLNHGLRASLPHLAGIGFGMPAMFLALGLGFGVVFERFPALHFVIKVVGTLYLIYLAWCIARSSSVKTKQGGAKPFTFLQAILFQWVNPKGWIFVMTTIGTFTVVGQHFLVQMLSIALVFVVVGFLSGGSWLLFGFSLQKLLEKPLYRNVFNITMALFLLISVLPVTLQMLNFS